MKILLDTNVVLDVLLDNEQFREDSYGAMKKALEDGHIIYLSASAATDIFYVLRKALGSKSEALSSMKDIMKIIFFAKVDEDDILYAFASRITDFEDAVVDSVAASLKADFILTRNKKDFKYASNKILSPGEYLKKYN